jgi:spermidine synthase
LAILYFSNSLGAAIGVLVSGFVLIEAVGLPGTIFTAGLINLFLTLMVWLLSHNDEPQPVAERQISSSFPPSQQLLVAFLFCAFFTGLSSFLYEVGWIRLLSLILGSSTHAFELMLSAFILGLALGGYWIKSRIDKLTNPVNTLGWIQIFMGLLALSTLVSYEYAFQLMSYMMTALMRNEEGYLLFNLVSHGIAMFIMVPATFCAGMTLPLLTYHLIAKGHAESAIGGIYAANTLGAIFGVILGVQFIMPELGLKNLITLGGGIDILLGLILLWYASSKVPKIQWGLTASVTTGIVIASVLWVELDPILLASSVFRSGKLERDIELLYHKDGKTASVDLLKTADHTIGIRTNGKPDASIGETKPSPDEPTMVLVGALAYATQLQTKTVANIGLGSGLTSHTLLAIPALETVDTIEIEPAMVEGAKGFGKPVERTFNDPRSHIYIEDAKTFFTNHPQRYDIIISEPSNPWVSGVAGLFSTEFYQRVRPHLTENGQFVQWFHLYEMDIKLVSSIFKAISANFEDYAVYFTSVYFTMASDIVIIAKPHGKVSEPSDAIFAIPQLAADLDRLGIGNRQDLTQRYLGNKQILDPLFQSYDIPANSDYFPVLDLGAVKARFLGLSVSELHRFVTSPAPLIETLEGQPARTVPLLEVGDNLDFTIALQARQAKQIYHYFQALQADKSPYSVPLDSNSLVMVQNFRELHHSPCPVGEVEVKGFTGQLETAWLPYLKMLMEATLPFLSPMEMEMIWRDLEAVPSVSCLPESLHHWISLYKAVGNRQFEQVLQEASALLPEGRITPSADHNYLVMVSLLAYLALQQPDAALTFWHRYVYEKVDHLPIELRWLVAVAVQRKGEMK